MTTPEQKFRDTTTEQPAWLVALSQKLDDLLRILDLRLRRTAGGWMDRRLKIDRHTVAALWLPSVLCGLLVLGSPTLGRFFIAAAVAVVVCAGLIWQMRSAARKRRPLFFDLLAQGLVVSAVGAVVWFSGPDSYTAIQPYRHLLIPLAVATVVALIVGAALLGPIFRWPLEQSRYGEYLKQTELFLSRGKTPPFSAATFLSGVAASVVHAPLALLTLPAIATLLAPPVWIPLVPLIAAAVCAIALLLAGLNDRFAAMWILFQQSLLSGGALLVSAVVVVLAALRLGAVTYVTTIFDSAAWWTITTVFVSAYVLSWWFDYWSQRMLTDRVLRLIDRDAIGVAQIPYPITKEATHTSVPWDERVLQVHGAGRSSSFARRARTTTFRASRRIRRCN